jgi:Calmodulin-binding
VPAYLLKRRASEARAEAERLATLPDPDAPPGMKLMSEEERLETLARLQECGAEAQKQVRVRGALTWQYLLARNLLLPARLSSTHCAWAELSPVSAGWPLTATATMCSECSQCSARQGPATSLLSAPVGGVCCDQC